MLDAFVRCESVCVSEAQRRGVGKGTQRTGGGELVLAKEDRRPQNNIANDPNQNRGRPVLLHARYLLRETIVIRTPRRTQKPRIPPRVHTEFGPHCYNVLPVIL